MPWCQSSSVSSRTGARGPWPALLTSLAAYAVTAMALEMLAQAEGRFDEPTVAPWNPMPSPLGSMLLMGITHLNQHKGQLFYYLKLQGKPVHTGTLWGMPDAAAS